MLYLDLLVVNDGSKFLMLRKVLLLIVVLVVVTAMVILHRIVHLKRILQQLLTCVIRLILLDDHPLLSDASKGP